MVLLLGVCRALKALHQYRVKRTGDVKGARKVKAEAQRADREAEEEVEEQELQANSSRRRRKEEMRMEAGGDGDVEEEPLMDDEVTASQQGMAPGEIRAYAHRDIKPGMMNSGGI